MSRSAVLVAAALAMAAGPACGVDPSDESRIAAINLPATMSQGGYTFTVNTNVRLCWLNEANHGGCDPAGSAGANTRPQGFPFSTYVDCPVGAQCATNSCTCTVPASDFNQWVGLEAHIHDPGHSMTYTTGNNSTPTPLTRVGKADPKCANDNLGLREYCIPLDDPILNMTSPTDTPPSHFAIPIKVNMNGVTTTGSTQPVDVEIRFGVTLQPPN